MKSKIALLCVSSAIAILMGEALLRVALPNNYYIWPPHLKRVFRPDPHIMPGISGESKFEINSIGFRGDELASSHAHRILTIGGSTTECLYLDQSETWPNLLQSILNDNLQGHDVWVGNAGMAARTTSHHLIAMQYLPLKEMKIDTVIFLIGVNDLHNFSDGGSRDPQNLSASEMTETLLYETFKGGMRQAHPQDPFYKKTAIWRLIRNIKNELLQKADRNNIQDEFGMILSTWREHRRNAREIRTELPDLSSGLKSYSDNINKIIDIAQQKALRVIFMTQPTMWKAGLSADLDSLLWLGGIDDFQSEGGKPYYSTEALDRGMKQYNNRLLNICQLRKVECIDLTVLDKDTTVFYDDVHFNESGAQKVANMLASHMLDQYAFSQVQ
jgi:lysophospholipase L1-like esterase